MASNPYGPKDAGNQQRTKSRPSDAEVDELVDIIIASSLGTDPE